MKFRLRYALFILMIGVPIQLTAGESFALEVGQELLAGESQLSCQNSDLPQESVGTELGMIFLVGPLACAQVDCACHDQVGCKYNSDCGSCEGTPCFCSALVSPKRCVCP
jgi:hypothetical protein